MKETQVGISKIKVVIPPYWIETKIIAEERGLKPGFPEKGLRVEKARIPYDVSLPDLAAEAVRKIDYQDVRRFYVATESDYNLSQPMGIEIVNEKLGLTVVPVQNKLACAAGVQALILACEYVRNQDKPAVVIIVDRLIYRKTQPAAEITQGCAAVAIRVEKNPKLLAIDPHTGEWAKKIGDFTTPISGAPFPTLNGPLTIPTYLRCDKGALDDFKKNNPELGSILEELAYIIFHVPFSKMIEWAAAALYRHEKYREEEHLTLDDCIKDTSLYPEYKKEIDRIRKTPEFKEFLEKKIEPGLKYNLNIGNSGGCSVFISLISVLEKIKKGQKIGIMGYGSGAAAIAVMATAITSDFHSDLSEQIKQGEEISFEQYKEWRLRTWKETRGDLSSALDLWKEVLKETLGVEGLKVLKKTLETALKEVQEEIEEEEAKKEKT